MSRITDMRSELQAESSVWLFKSPLAGGGGMLWRPTVDRTVCYNAHLKVTMMLTPMLTVTHTHTQRSSLSRIRLYRRFFVATTSATAGAEQ